MFILYTVTSYFRLYFCMFPLTQVADHGFVGFSWRSSIGSFHRLEVDIRLCAIHQRQVQEGRVTAVDALKVRQTYLTINCT